MTAISATAPVTLSSRMKSSAETGVFGRSELQRLPLRTLINCSATQARMVRSHGRNKAGQKVCGGGSLQFQTQRKDGSRAQARPFDAPHFKGPKGQVTCCVTSRLVTSVGFANSVHSFALRRGKCPLSTQCGHLPLAWPVCKFGYRPPQRAIRVYHLSIAK